jgi:hypothetical protein
MPSDDEFEDDAAEEPDEWEQFREDDGEPISIEEPSRAPRLRCSRRVPDKPRALEPQRGLSDSAA